MLIKQEFLLKHLELAALEQLTEEYRGKGYTVMLKSRARDVGVDLLVRKGDDVIAFVLKASPWTPERRREMVASRNRAVHTLNARYELVLVDLPERTDVVFEDLERVFDDLLPDRFVNVFDRLATHYWIDEITDAEFERLYIEASGVEVMGSATVTLGLQYGSDAEQGGPKANIPTESFRFHFHLRLDRDFKLVEIILLELDQAYDLD